MEQISGYRPNIEIDSVFVRKDKVKNLCSGRSRLFEKIGATEPTPLCIIRQIEI